MSGTTVTSPPELSEDLIHEILLRVTPRRPAVLIRCSAVSKAWRRLLTSASFLRRYRDFHGTAPLLGFLFNRNAPEDDDLIVPQFVRVTPFRPRARARDRLDWLAHDARHGRVLLHICEGSLDQEMALVVWDPVTGEEWEIPMPDGDFGMAGWDATVVCAAHASACNCNHRHCHGGPFLVAFVGNLGQITYACVYSSEAGAWGDATTADNTGTETEMAMCPAALVGNTLYFMSYSRATLVEYDLGRQKLAFIGTPFTGNAVVMPWEGARLGFAAVPWRSSTLHLFSWDALPDGTAVWTEHRVIDLKAAPTLNNPRFHIMWLVSQRASVSSSSAQTPASSRCTWNQAEARRCSTGNGKEYPRSFLTRASILQIMLGAADHQCQGNAAVHPFHNVIIDETF